MEMVGTIASAAAAVQDRISQAAQRAGRDRTSIRLMAVTKGFPQQVVLDARAVGLSLFGENRVQEAEQKYLDQAAGLELHLIGHLQRNKARAASGLFACVQSIDKAETAEALDARCEERGRTMDILLELNTSGEPAKSGFVSRQALREGLERIGRLAHLRIRGLMTVGPLSDDEKRIRSAFRLLRSLFEEIRSNWRTGFDTLSMGMSGDFMTAIEEGSTLVRIGTALFGKRQPR
jgi:pyridoxal phosphate enzyme (YggS family)